MNKNPELKDWTFYDKENWVYDEIKYTIHCKILQPMHEDEIYEQIALILTQLFKDEPDWFDKILKYKTINIKNKCIAQSNYFYWINYKKHIMDKINSILHPVKFSRNRTYKLFSDIIFDRNLDGRGYNEHIKVKLILEEAAPYHFIIGFSNRQPNDKLLQKISRSPIFDRNILRLIWSLSLPK